MSADTVESPSEGGDASADPDLSVALPVCWKTPVPGYPEAEVETAPESVEVAVDFTIAADGTIIDPAAEAAPEVPTAFRTAAEAIVLTWRCTPAWRPTPDDDPAWVDVPYRARATFLFSKNSVTLHR